jgi:hypothetical protein
MYILKKSLFLLGFFITFYPSQAVIVRTIEMKKIIETENPEGDTKTSSSALQTPSIILYGDCPIGMSTQEDQNQKEKIEEIWKKHEERIETLQVLYEGMGAGASYQDFVSAYNKIIDLPLNSVLLNIPTLTTRTPYLINCEPREFTEGLLLLANVVSLTFFDIKNGLDKNDKKLVQMYEFLKDKSLNIANFVKDWEATIKKVEKLDFKNFKPETQNYVQLKITEYKQFVAAKKEALNLLNELLKKMAPQLEIDIINDPLLTILEKIKDAVALNPFMGYKIEYPYQKAAIELALQLEQKFTIINDQMIEETAQKYQLNRDAYIQFKKLLQELIDFDVKILPYQMIISFVQALSFGIESLDINILHHLQEKPSKKAVIFTGFIHTENLISLLQKEGYEIVYDSTLKLQKNNQTLSWGEAVTILNNSLQELQLSLINKVLAGNKLSFKEIYNREAMKVPFKAVDLIDFERIVA